MKIEFITKSISISEAMEMAYKSGTVISFTALTDNTDSEDRDSYFVSAEFQTAEQAVKFATKVKNKESQ